MWKGVTESKKAKRPSKEEIKKQLLESMIIEEVVAYHQGKTLKRFKEKEKFVKLVSELGIHKTTIIFKINVYKLSEKYPKLLRSSIGLGFFKNYHKDIKAVCEEIEKDFQQ